MSQTISITGHVKQVYEIYRRYLLQIVNLDLFFLWQVAAVVGVVALSYLANLPWYIIVLLGVVGFGVLNISWLGLSKNFFAFARDRGHNKYPLFVREYFLLGLPVITVYLLTTIVPATLWLGSVVAGLRWQFPYWQVVVLATTIFYFALQWYTSLAPALIIDKKMSVYQALRTSIQLTRQNRYPCLMLSFYNHLLLVTLSVTLPIVGTILAGNWQLLSSFHLQYRLKSLTN